MNKSSITCGRFGAVACILAISLMLASCDFAAGFTGMSDKTVKLNGTTGTIIIKVSPGAARTIVPDAILSAKSFAVEYKNLTNPGLSGRASLLTGSTLTVPNVYPGTMQLTVYAYSSATVQDSSTQMASGVSDIFTLTEGMTKDVSVLLAMTQTSTVTTGSFSLDVLWPVSTGANKLLATIINPVNNIIEALPVNYEVASDTVSYSATVTPAATLKSGTYLLRLTFGSTTAGFKQQIFTETVNIYDGAVSTYWINPTGELVSKRTFTEEEFFSSDRSVQLTATTGTETDVISFSPTGVMDSNFGTTNKVFMRIKPDSATPGQSVAFRLNGGTSTKIVMGEFTSVRLALDDNILQIIVTAPATGTSETYTMRVHVDQIEIDSEAELLAIDPDSAYILTDQIDLTGDWKPIAEFRGELDGNGKDITNLKYTFTEDDATQGGLIMSNSGTIKNLVVSGAEIESNSMSQDGTSEVNCGVLVGTNTGTLYHCATSGNINLMRMINDGLGRIGGLAGNNYYPGVIEECYSVATVNTMQGEYVGGLVGTNQSKVLNSYTRGAVTGKLNCGGLVGINEKVNGSVVNCYSTGFVAGIEDFANGGCTGATDTTPGSAATLTASYYDSEESPAVTGSEDPDELVALHGIPYTTNKMKNKDSFTDWDFDTVWGIDTNGTINAGYPYLQYFRYNTGILLP